MRTIRASEIGTYLYCQRAWWYQRLGYQSWNQAEMAAGQETHARHGRSLFIAGVVRTMAIGLILLSLVLFIAYLIT
jgi:hypothetical protein